MENILKILTQLLEAFDYKVDDRKLRERLLSDPDPEVVAITNTLDYFNIKNLVATVPKEALHALPKTFMGQISERHKFNLVLVTQEAQGHVVVRLADQAPITLKEAVFLEMWTGVVIAIEANEDPQPKSYKRNWISGAYIGLALLYVLYMAIAKSAPLEALYLSVLLIGGYVSYLIVQEKLQAHSKASKFCKLSKHTDCQSVLNSKGSKLFGVIDLSDLSFMYFTILTIAFISGAETIIYKGIALAALPMIVYSVFYQYVNLKKWCPLCLSIGGIVVAQSILAYFLPQTTAVSFWSLMPLLFIVPLVAMTWPQIKKLLEAKAKNDHLSIENLRFRRDHRLFLPYYESLKSLEFDPRKNLEIVMGSVTPLVTMHVITNPSCKNCKEAHQVYHTLLKKYPDAIQLKLVFLVPYNERNAPKTMVSERLIQIYHEGDAETFERALNAWYEQPQFKNWTQTWGTCDNEQYNAILKQQVQWCLQHDIGSTPTTIINGKLFPESYHPKDIEHFMAHIIERERHTRVVMTQP